jgi:hypothetical protein
MSTNAPRKCLNRADLEAEIIVRLWARPECADITHVSVKPTGLVPPQPSWEIAGVARRAVGNYGRKSIPSMESALNELTQEFDLRP